MQELLQKVQEKIALEEELLELEQEQKRLKKEVFDLRIVANNEQVDVYRLEGFSLRSLALGLTGKKEEQLELERREARNAKAKYDFAAARLAIVEQRLAEIPMRLQELLDCDIQLLKLLQEKLGKEPCPEETQKCRSLEETIAMTRDLQTRAEDLEHSVSIVQGLIGADRRSSWIADEVRKAERSAQRQLNEFVELACALELRLKALDLGCGLDAYQQFDESYIWDNLFGKLDRCLNVLIEVRHTKVTLRKLIPKLERQLRNASITLQQLLVETVAGSDQKG